MKLSQKKTFIFIELNLTGYQFKNCTRILVTLYLNVLALKWHGLGGTAVATIFKKKKANTYFDLSILLLLLLDMPICQLYI